MQKRRILIFGGATTSAAGLGARLTTLGHEVTAGDVSAGVPATSALGANGDRSEPELLLIDAEVRRAPVVEEIIEAARRLHVAVLLVVADEDGSRSLQEGLGDDHVVMPCTDRELRLAMELALRTRASAREGMELEDRFFAVSVDMLCFLGFNGYFRRLNPAWERTLGFTREELMSRPFIEFVHPDDRQRTLEQNRTVRHGGQALGFENRYLCKDGSFRWLLWNAAPDIAENVIYSAARDITARKQAEDERERLVRELQTALAEVRALREILPICSYCRRIRDDQDYWQTVESYISRHTKTRFSHGICPTCMTTEIRDPDMHD